MLMPILKLDACEIRELASHGIEQNTESPLRR